MPYLRKKIHDCCTGCFPKYDEEPVYSGVKINMQLLCGQSQMKLAVCNRNDEADFKPVRLANPLHSYFLFPLVYFTF
jgi:hypothetical protein